MASLNATDTKNMPVALESLDACAPHNQRNQDSTMATEDEDSEKGSAEDEEHEQGPIDALIDSESKSGSGNRNIVPTEHRTNIEQIKSMKSLIASDEISNDSIHQRLQTQTSQFDERKCNESDDSTENSPNVIMNQNENTGDGNTDDINELDNIFGLDSHNGLTSPSKGKSLELEKTMDGAVAGPECHRLNPTESSNDIQNNLITDDREENSSLQNVFVPNSCVNNRQNDANLEVRVFNDDNQTGHQSQLQHDTSTLHPNVEQMHQYEQRMYQYNQQMNMAHESNLSSHHLSQQQQQHQMDMQIRRDNDTHYQYKMYSHPSMYMPPVNGYGNSFNNNSQHQQAQIQQTTPFKPYQLDSPATPSTKHSNISSAPGTPSSLDQRTPQQQQQQDDPYNFVDDDMHSLPTHGNHLAGIGSFGLQQMRTTFNMNNESIGSIKNTMLPSLHKSMDTQNSPKKRGRKKKVRNDDGQMIPLGLSNETGITVKPPATKERKKHDRFNGMSEEEVSKRTLPDHLSNNLDIIIIGINPGLFAAYRGHHYAGPGNHFWKCLYLSGLTHEQMNAEEDFKLLDHGIGFTNMVQRATKGSADLTRKEIKEGSRLLHEKLRRYRPKIAVFNGKLIFEVFSGKKDFNFGRQPECVEGTNTYMWVMPSSSARCAQLPRAADKVPFYAALKKFRDYLNGIIPHIDESECVFADPKSKVSYENDSSKDTLSVSRFPQNSNSGMGMLGGPMSDIMHHHPSDMTDINNSLLSGENDMTDMRMMDVPTKKKRGRPKKVRGEGEENIKITVPRRPQNTTQETELMGDDVVPKKKRGRPKKVKSDNIDGMMINSKLPANSINIEKIINETALDSERPIFSPAMSKSISSQDDHQLSQAPAHSHKQQSTQTQKQQNQSSMNLFSQMSNNNSSLNINNSNGNIQCAMNGGFNQNMQHSSFQSHEHSSQHHNQSTTASDSPQQFSHSDLSSDISAAISTSEHIQPHSASAIGTVGNGDTNSPSSNSQSIAATDFETPDCVHNDSWNDHSPFSVSQQPSNTPHHWQQKSTSMGVNAPNSQYLSVDPQKSSSIDPQKSPFVSIDAAQSQLNAHQMHLQHHHQQLHLQQHVQSQLSSFQSPHHLQTHHTDEINAYMAKQAAQSQQQPQTSSQQQQQQQQQQQTTITDVTAKSLSGLESLVDQIPSLSDNHDSTGPQSSSVHSLSSLRSSENRLNDIPSMVGEVEHHQTTPFQNSCLYSTNYLSNTSSNLGSSILSSSSASNELQRCNSNRSRNSDMNGSSTPTNLMSHYPASNYSSSSSSVIMPSVSGLHSPNSPHTQTQTSPMNPLNNHPFSVSNLTGNHTNYSLTPPPSTPSASMPMNSYHSNFMAAAMQPPLYIHDFYDKTHPPIPPDFFQKTGRQPSSNVDPHFQSFYHSHAAAAAAAGLSSYGQHSGFSSASYGFSANEFFDKTPTVQSQTQAFSASNPTMPIMPSPNYPYGYSEHHRRQNYIASDLTFFPNHGMFDHR